MKRRGMALSLADHPARQIASLERRLASRKALVGALQSANRCCARALGITITAVLGSIERRHAHVAVAALAGRCVTGLRVTGHAVTAGGYIARRLGHLSWR